MMVQGIARRGIRATIGTAVFGTALPLLISAVMVAGADAQDQPAMAGTIKLELNKVESQQSGCRVYFVLDNGTTDAFESFKLDLVVFAPDGVILRNLATEMGPLRPEKRVVKMFDLSDQPCDGIGSLLVNDVLECQSAGGPRPDCVDLLTVESRAGASLVK